MSLPGVESLPLSWDPKGQRRTPTCTDTGKLSLSLGPGEIFRRVHRL